MSWGEILGADRYTLYGRKRGSDKFEQIYKGNERSTQVKLADTTVYEFTVTATNGNGESKKSVIVDTDRNRFINWSPIPGEKFRRDPENQENGYIEYNPWVEDQMKLLTYPK